MAPLTRSEGVEAAARPFSAMATTLSLPEKTCHWPSVPLTATAIHALQSLSGAIVYNLLALITGFAAGRCHIAGARQGFMVYFSHVIHGKFDGSNEKTSIAVRVLQAISGNTTSAPELAMKRCGR